MEFAVSGLKRTETGRDQRMVEKSCKSKSFQNLVNCIKIRNGLEIGKSQKCNLIEACTNSDIWRQKFRDRAYCF